ncbi:MAG: sialate O-acetylesterase [Muribaculaceae bacterium]
MKQRIFLSITLILSSCTIFAQTHTPISMPSLFADGMVLQQQCEAPIWGYAQAGTKVKIVGSWNLTDTVTASVDDCGKWKAKIRTTSHGGPYTLQVFSTSNSSDRITLNDVMLGEVWLCSGQSNMEWTPNNGITNKDQEIANANYPNIRYFSLKKRGSLTKQDDCEARWEACSPEVMAQRSALAYFFGSRLHQQLGIPIGLIVSAWGGTPAEVWIPEEEIQANQQLQGKLISEKAAWWPIEPSRLYNSMINPLVPYAIAGAIWYQGESNRTNASVYHLLMKQLIESWRKAFNNDFPFYMVQIAPYNYNDTKNNATYVREAQQKACEIVPNTALVVTNDVGDITNIHPAKKQEVGIRLANMALGRIYHKMSDGYETSFLDSHSLQNGKLSLTFSHAGDKLICSDKEIAGLRIINASGMEVTPKVRIVGNKLVIDLKKTKLPVTVYYCFDDVAIGNLFNCYGLPIAPFHLEISNN